MGSKPNFTNLRVYQLSERLADEVWNVVTDWDYFAKDTVGKQLVRSADRRATLRMFHPPRNARVGANLAEGHGRYGHQDKKRFIHIARGSLNETRHWLRRAYTRKLLTTEQTQKIQPIIDDLSPMLNAYLNSITPR